jgi:hypothetical protein
MLAIGKNYTHVRLLEKSIFENLLKYQSKFHQSHPKHIILYIFQFQGLFFESKLKFETFFEKV